MLFAAFVLRDIYFLVGSYMLTAVVGTFVNAWPNRKIIGYSYAEQIRDICPAFLLGGGLGGRRLPRGPARAARSGDGLPCRWR